MKYVVELDWLAQHLRDSDLRIIDCRFDLGNPHAGREKYLEEHIANAFYFDLATDLSGSKESHGGRHPLPDLEQLAKKLGEAGIDETVKVVAYDDQGGAMASRFWWLLTYLGHPHVYVLNSGFTAWKLRGYPVTNEVPNVVQRTFTPKIKADMLVQMTDVKASLGKNGVSLIDSREGMRYLGIEESIDPVAGHIPGAVNYFWRDNLRENGEWKAAEELQARFQALSKSEEIIVYCGSGVTACPNILALKEAGFSNVKLYAGSWSDWISYSNNPIQ